MVYSGCLCGVVRYVTYLMATRTAWVRSLPIAVALVVVASPQPAFAADSLRYLRAYMCDPSGVTLAIVRRCVQANPERSAEFERVGARWEQNNGDAALVLKEQCTAVMRKRGRSEAAVEALQAKVNRLNASTVSVKAAEIADDPGVCESILAEIASDKITSDKADLGKLARRKR